MSQRTGEALKALGGGLFLGVVGVGIYWYLWDFEQSADTSRRIHSLVALLYDIGGKPLASAPFVLMGLFGVGKGAYMLVTPGSGS